MHSSTEQCPMCRVSFRGGVLALLATNAQNRHAGKGNHHMETYTYLCTGINAKIWAYFGSQSGFTFVVQAPLVGPPIQYGHAARISLRRPGAAGVITPYDPPPPRITPPLARTRFPFCPNPPNPHPHQRRRRDPRMAAPNVLPNGSCHVNACKRPSPMPFT